MGIAAICLDNATRVVKRSGGREAVDGVRPVMHAVIGFNERGQRTFHAADGRLPTAFRDRKIGMEQEGQNPSTGNNRKGVIRS